MCIIRPIFLFLFYLILCSVGYLECHRTPSPSPRMRPTSFANQLNYDIFCFSVYEILILTIFICVTLCNIASTFIINIKYITFDKFLDYVQSTINQLAIELLIFILKVYVQTCLSFIYLCAIFFPNLNPYIRFVFLCFFEMVLLLSTDIEIQPGPSFNDSFFSFCNWNINTLSKNDFQRVSLLEAHNSIFKYDIISLCETSLNEATNVAENILKGYHFFSSNHPSGDKKGGVHIFYKESLTLKIRHDLSFEECIVTEPIFGHKKTFFAVLYRNPIHKVDTPEFENFVQNFKELYEKILNENPYTILFTGDFNAHLLNWWSQGDNTQEGIQLDNLFSDLNLTQIVSEPTHFMENCHPSCIDLIICDQPNLLPSSGVRPSLDPTCKHHHVHTTERFGNLTMLTHLQSQARCPSSRGMNV